MNKVGVSMCTSTCSLGTDYTDFTENECKHTLKPYYTV